MHLLAQHIHVINILYITQVYKHNLTLLDSASQFRGKKRDDKNQTKLSSHISAVVHNNIYGK